MTPQRKAAELPGDATTSAGASEPEFYKELDSVSRGIHDPVAKLRYLRSSIARYQQVDQKVDAVRWGPLRRGLTRWLSLLGLGQVPATDALGAPTRLDAATRSKILMGQAVVLAVGLGVTVGLAALVHGLGSRSDPPPRPVATPRPPAPVVAESLAPLPAGLAPGKVWLVERGPAFEQYSNGLRIDTTYAIAAEPRRFRIFSRDGTLRPEVHEQPVGLLFHTTESDIWPLEASFNEKLRDSSQRLLRYIQRNKSYHYVIDRFGRVFRVVEEGSKANHAGHAVWANGDDVYLSLNNAFLGISFETRWEGGRALPITAAQLAAGRSLADNLRQRFEIPPELCVTHGLVSVNPHNHLIGHHLDWARGFPFAAFGMPDQYEQPPASIGLFGFGYDEAFLATLGGEPWAGVMKAEQGLAAEAARIGQSVEALRRARRADYDRWLAEQTRAEEATTQAAVKDGHRSGG